MSSTRWPGRRSHQATRGAAEGREERDVLVVLAGQFVEEPQHGRRIRHGVASCHPGNGRSALIHWCGSVA